MRFFLSQACVLLLLSAGLPVHCVQVFLSCSHISCSHKLPLSADPPEAINLCKLPCITVNWVLIEVSIVSFSVHPAQGPETIPALVAPCWFIFARSFCFFLFIVQQEAETVWWERITKKYDILMQRWSFESVPEISLPPCIPQQRNCRWQCEPTCFSSSS